MRYASLRDGLQLAICPSVSGGGGIVPDLSGKQNHASLVNMEATAFPTSYFGIVSEFGVLVNSDRLLIQDSPTLDVGICGTLSAWCFFRATSVFQHILSKGGGRAVLDLNGNGHFRGYLNNGFIQVSTNTGPVTNQWYHVALTWDGENVRIWLDGILRNTVSQSQTPSGSGVYMIGNYALSPSLPIYGQVNDVRVYNRDLKQQEIRLLAGEPGIGLRPERTSVFFGAKPSARRRKILTGQV